MSLTVLDRIKAYKLIEIENDKKIKPLSDIPIFLYSQMVFGLIPNVNCYARFTPRQQS